MFYSSSFAALIKIHGLFICVLPPPQALRNDQQKKNFEGGGVTWMGMSYTTDQVAGKMELVGKGKGNLFSIDYGETKPTKEQMLQQHKRDSAADTPVAQIKPLLKADNVCFIVVRVMQVTLVFLLHAVSFPVLAERSSCHLPSSSCMILHACLTLLMCAWSTQVAPQFKFSEQLSDYANPVYGLLLWIGEEVGHMDKAVTSHHWKIFCEVCFGPFE